MRCIPEAICGMDSDVLLSYPTIKYVRILDARLGLFKYAVSLMIVLYIGVYQLWYEGLYLEQLGVTGAVRFTLQQPTMNGCDPTDRGCKNAFSDTESLRYCAQSAGAEGEYTGSVWPCEFYENIGTQIVMDKSIAAASRITQYEQELVCSATQGEGGVSDCPFVYNLTRGEQAEKTTYVVDAERFTVLIDHSVLADSADAAVNKALQAASSQIKGRLYVANNDALCAEFQHSAKVDYRGEQGSLKRGTAPCYIAPNTTSKNLDYFSIDVLMRAADKSLDSVNYVDPVEGPLTYRYTGVTMLLQITYSNFRGNFKGLGDIAYYYTPMLVSGSSYKYYQPQYTGPSQNRSVTNSYRSTRTLNNMHGTFIEAVQGGSLYTWSFNNLLIQLTTSLTLFAVATVITDFVAIYLMPDHETYEKYKYEVTEDFSDRRDRAATLAEGSQGGGGGGGGASGGGRHSKRGDALVAPPQAPLLDEDLGHLAGGGGGRSGGADYGDEIV